MLKVRIRSLFKQHCPNNTVQMSQEPIRKNAQKVPHALDSILRNQLVWIPGETVCRYKWIRATNCSDNENQGHDWLWQGSFHPLSRMPAYWTAGANNTKSWGCLGYGDAYWYWYIEHVMAIALGVDGACVVEAARYLYTQSLNMTIKVCFGHKAACG